MKNIKLLLVMAVGLLSLSSAMAQNQKGVKAHVVDRMTRQAVGGASVTIMPGSIVAKTNENGDFVVEDLESGEYQLNIEAGDYESVSITFRVVNEMKDLYHITLTPVDYLQSMDQSAFAEYDMENGDNTTASYGELSSSSDIFTNIASYKFSEMRFNARGYFSQAQEVSLNGVYFNDAMSGYSPWSLWSGLNDAVRNRESKYGLLMDDQGVGGYAGTVNINTRPSEMRKGWSLSMASSGAMYRYRAMATYASGYQDNGWAYAFSVSTRQGGNDYVDGIFYNTFGYFASVEKQFNDQHNLMFMIMGAPTDRGAQQASTQEAYDLVGSNYYNPNWGYINGEMYNSRVRNSHEPIAMLTYKYNITERSQLDVTTSLRFGENGYSALTWYGGPDPRPDYYRYLPSYYDDTYVGAYLAEAWMHDTDNISHINFDRMFSVNETQSIDDRYDGLRSIYMIEERHTDQLDWNFNTKFSHLFDDNSKLLAGVNVRRNRTEYYSEVKDLLGGDYWIDVDKFAERDMGASNELAYQNNLDYYDEHGHAQDVRVGDKYSHDYYGHLFNTSAWAQYKGNVDNFHYAVGGELAFSQIWREGLWRKGLFPENSQGNSEMLDFVGYKAKVNLEYRFNQQHTIALNGLAMADAPTFTSAFISPRTRNDVVPGLDTEKILAADLTYNVKVGDLRMRLTGYFTDIKDASKLMSYYDDVETTYTNLAMTGIDKRHYGLEAAITVPIWNGISANAAASLGNYTYTSNPDYVQYQDNNSALLNSGKVYWEGYHIESTPQTALNVGLAYRSSRNLFVNIDCNYYQGVYLSMNPMYRTDAVLTQGMSDQAIYDIRKQQEFAPSYVLNASIGKNWYLTHTSSLGVSLQINNILNNQSIRTGGYEQIRLQKNLESDYTSYEPFDAKYFYMLGTTYYLNVYLRF